MTTALRRFVTRLRRDTGGLAMLEFGLMLPIFVMLCVDRKSVV